MPGIGSLFVDLQLRMAQFQQSSDQARKAIQGIETTASRAAGALKALGGFVVGGLAVGQLAQQFRELINTADSIGDLGAAFGLTAEQLGNLRNVAQISGIQLQDLETIFAKFADRLAEGSAGSPQVLEDLKLLGITADDLKSKNFDQLIRKALTAIDGFEGGANKVALLRDNFGKTGIAMDDFAGNVRRLAGDVDKLGAKFTDELAENAGKFNDQLALLAVNAEKTKVALLSELLPAINRIAEEFLNAKKEGDGFISTLLRVFRTATIGNTQQISDREITNLVDEKLRLERQIGEIEVAVAQGVQRARAAGVDPERVTALADTRLRVLRGVLAQVDERIKSTQALRKTLEEPVTGAEEAQKRVPAPARVDLGRQSAEAKAAADEALKALDREIKGEQELLQQRNEINKTLLDQNQITFEDFFKNRETIAGESTTRLQAIYDEQLEILKKLARTVPQAEQPAVRTRIAETEDRREGVATAAAFENTRAFFEQLKATQEYERKLVDVRASLLELTGELERAAGIKFDLANMELLRQAILKNDEAAISLVERLRAVTVANAQAAALQDDAGRVREALANAEARVRIEQELGASSELEGLQKVSAARQKALVELEAIAKKFAEIAERSGDERLKLQADSFRRSVEELAAAADLVSQKFRQIGESGVSNLFADLLDGTKSVKEAFADMGRSILQEVNKLVAQDLASRLFKSVFGGAGKSGGSPLDFIGSIFSSIFGDGSGPQKRAMGGPVSSGTPYLVGEQGPELFVPRASGSIVAAGRFGGGGGPLVQNFYISGAVDARTRSQVARDALDGAMRAKRRDG
jgi:hypothetical protein